MGSVLTIEKARAMDITASFITLKNSDGIERLYAWPYYADNEFELIGEAASEVITVKATRVDDIPEELLVGALDQAAESGVVSGEQRMNDQDFSIVMEKK